MNNGVLPIVVLSQSFALSMLPHQYTSQSNDESQQEDHSDSNTQPKYQRKVVCKARLKKLVIQYMYLKFHIHTLWIQQNHRS